MLSSILRWFNRLQLRRRLGYFIMGPTHPTYHRCLGCGRWDVTDEDVALVECGNCGVWIEVDKFYPPLLEDNFECPNCGKTAGLDG